MTRRSRQTRGPLGWLLISGLAFSTLTSCTSDTDEDLEPPLAGGETTLNDRTSSAFENPAPNLTAEELEQHLAGDVGFEAAFVTAPAEVNPGLGPYYNNRACANCHLRDGRGLPVVGSGSAGTQLLVRVSLPEGEPAVPGGPVPVPGLGNQLRDHAIYGYTAPARVALLWSETPGTYPADGAPYVLRRVTPRVTLADGSSLSSEVLVSLRLPPPVFGLGLLEALPEDALLAMADPGDSDGDGISGRINQVWDARERKQAVGRFGWKAANPSLLQQAAGAYSNDMGVSTPLFAEEDGSFEVDAQVLEDVTFYTQTLAVPMRRDWDDPLVMAGEQLFRDLQCASCHVETLETGVHPVKAVSQQKIHPYTDLLLHDMGEGLADLRPDFEASGTEWRTPALWGIGLTETVLGQAAFLHDGRAQTLEEAILWHGGEAEPSREEFRTLSGGDREALLAFLRSL